VSLCTLLVLFFSRAREITKNDTVPKKKIAYNDGEHSMPVTFVLFFFHGGVRIATMVE